MGLICLEDPVHQEYLLSLCQVLSYSVLAITAWYKLPQVYAVLASRSSLGISMASLLLEFSSYSIEMTYQIAMAYPLETYFEIVLMWAQDVLLVYVVLDNRHLLTPAIAPWALLYVTCFTLTITRTFPDVIMFTLIASTTVILGVSKSMQLWTVVSTENPGSLSALTWSLLSYLAMVRILTTSVVTGDVFMLMNTTLATVLDIAVAVSIVYYNRVKARKARWRRQH